MIVGTGMVAEAMKSIAKDVVIFAAGESNSRCIDDEHFARERRLLSDVRDERLLVYFSTISVESDQQTPYMKHKLAMEELVRAGPHLILRLPNLAGPNQAAGQLIPSLVDQIRRGDITIHKGASRDILDVADVCQIVIQLLEVCRNDTIDVLSGYYISVEDIVNFLAQLLNTSPRIRYVPSAAYPEASVSKLDSLIDLSRYGFGPDYYKKVLKKYVQ